MREVVPHLKKQKAYKLNKQQVGRKEGRQEESIQRELTMTVCLIDSQNPS
jgi:hypothetical protein